VSWAESADLTGDGFDDVMLIGDRIATSGSTLVVVPANAPAATVSIPSDSTCSQ
jgi:hypothetical protein